MLYLLLPISEQFPTMAAFLSSFGPSVQSSCVYVPLCLWDLSIISPNVGALFRLVIYSRSSYFNEDEIKPREILTGLCAHHSPVNTVAEIQTSPLIAFCSCLPLFKIIMRFKFCIGKMGNAFLSMYHFIWKLCISSFENIVLFV